MIQLLSVGRRLLALLGSDQRRRARWLVPMLVLRAVIETAGVASVLPFMAVVASPQTSIENKYLGYLYAALGFESTTAFLVFLGSASLIVLVCSNALSVLVSYLMQRFAMRQRHLFQTRLMVANLALPYAAFLNMNTADVGEHILNEVKEVVDGVLSPYLQLIARAVAALAILVLLVVVNPILALITGAALGLTYALIFGAVRSKLSRIGDNRFLVDQVRYRTISEAYSGIKDVKVAGREQTYVDTFSRASERYSALSVLLHIINIVPKAGLEVIAFGGIVLIVLFLIGTGGTTSAVLSTITLYAFACYRLLPAVQQMYESVTQMRYSLPSLRVLERDLAGTEEHPQRFERPAPLGLTQGIEFVKVGFQYPGADQPSLRELSLQFPRNQSVALVGATGSGKTTIADLVLGLLIPSSGEIRVDGRALAPAAVRAWQATIGYVPQQVFLSDDTITANIAFGVPSHLIDHEAVERAAVIAQIHEFILDQPGGYATQVGERGVRLSGGQRQRLGIARALYGDPQVVVLDEATSALDTVTEGAVFDALAALSGRKTVIIVAHRLSTIRNCDRIYLIEQGRVAASGSYAELLHSSHAFRALAQHMQPLEAPVASSADDL